MFIPAFYAGLCCPANVCRNPFNNDSPKVQKNIMQTGHPYTVDNRHFMDLNRIGNGQQFHFSLQSIVEKTSKTATLFLHNAPIHILSAIYNTVFIYTAENVKQTV